MSYTNETTHFGIPLPLGSDLTTPMDYNTAAEAVDAALWQAGQDASTASSEAAGAVETANATAEALETLSGTVGTQGSAISTLQARMTGAENEISDVRSDLEDMITAFNEPTATSTHNYSIDDYFIYNDVLYKATAAINIGDTIVPNSNCSATNVMTEMSSGGGGSVAAADVSYDDVVTQLSANNVQAAIVALKTLIDNIPQGGGSMIALDFANPIKTFGASDTYTAQDGDYLHVAYLDVNASDTKTEIKIDGKTAVSTALQSTGGYNASGVYTQKLAATQVVTTDSHISSNALVYILNEV